MEKLGKERVYKHEKGRIVVGTTNYKDCKSIYIRIETWMTPYDSLFDSVKLLRRRIKANMRMIGPTYFQKEYNTYMLDVEFNQTKEKDKPMYKSFVAVEFDIFANTKFVFDNDLLFTAKNFADTIFEILETFEEDFEISPTKK